MKLHDVVTKDRSKKMHCVQIIDKVEEITDLLLNTKGQRASKIVI